MNRRSIIHALKYMFLALVLFFVAKFMIKSIKDLGDVHITIDYKFLVMAFLLHLIYLISRGSLWHFITCQNKINLSYGKALSIWFVSLLGKFIPGKLFYLGARIYHYKRNGKSGSVVAYSFFIEYMTTTAASILLFILSFSLIPSTAYTKYRYLGVILSCGLLALLHPQIMNFVLRLINRITKKDLPYLHDIKYHNILLTTLLYLVSWAVLGLGFFCVVRAVYPLSITSYPYAAGSFALATLIGIFSLFAPSGIGVREAVIIATMSQIMPAGLASIVSMLARVWATSSELFWIMIAYIVSKMRLPKKYQISEMKKEE